MRKTETLFIGAALLAAVAVAGGAIWYYASGHNNNAHHEYPTTQYGAFLAAQHAIYVNDFTNAAKFAGQLNEIEYATVQSTKFLADFLSGYMPDGVEILADEKTTASRLIYDAHLVQQGDWAKLYERHKKDESALAAPLRVWSSVATDRTKSALKFIKSLPTNESWQHFISGQIYAQNGDIKHAADEFASVSTDFMNMNDYMYVMSFYEHNNMDDAARTLHDEFTSRPGGLFMLDYDDVPEWSMFDGYANQLAFSLVQTVSHTQIMMYSDLAMLLLRFAQLTGPDFGQHSDAVNYYLGQFFYNNVGDYETYFNKISPTSPFYLFAVLRTADKKGDIDALEHATRENPLFVPAVSKLVAHNVQNGNRRAALRVIDAALADENLNEIGRAFFTKSRAQIYYTFGDLDAAQSDLYDASAVLPLDAEILALQAKIWAAQGREIENAYDYAMMLVKQDPTNIMAWDTLGSVVVVREGPVAALEILERVGEIAASCSSLFEHLGDLYVALDDEKLARDAYMRAIELSDDGLVVVPNLEKKLRKLK